MAAVSPASLRPVLKQHEPVVAEALAVLFPSPDAPVNLEGLRMAAWGDEDLADVLAGVLRKSKTAPSFAAFLAARGIALRRPKCPADILDAPAAAPSDLPPIAQPPDGDFPFEALAAFATRAAAFRCRIQLDGEILGSGAFVSARLVLTAAHVVERLLAASGGPAGPKPPVPWVVASDGRRHRARLVWHSPVFPGEYKGEIPGDTAAAQHRDVALLRVDMPLGQSYGHLDLPDPVVDWQGPRLLALVHYPQGRQRGFVPGRMLRVGPGDIRLRHDIRTAPGSSGGPGFDRDLRFVGIHQGRLNGGGRMVPHGQFAADPGFRGAIAGDVPPRYLWSLDGDPDGPIIVGRGRFFAGLAAMQDHPHSPLRGIWVRRLDMSRMTGLGFSFEMLRAFLARWRGPGDPAPQDRILRVPVAMGDRDLIAALARLALDGDAVEAHAGVREGETSDVAAQGDRAGHLAEAMGRRAQDQGRRCWLFFEAPPGGMLAEPARTQFEHLVDRLVLHGNLRLILAGFEQYALTPLRFQSEDEALTAARPGLLVDPLGHFTGKDVEVTIDAMLRDLAPSDLPDRPVLDWMVGRVTKELRQADAFSYHFDELPRAIDRIRAGVKLQVGLI